MRHVSTAVFAAAFVALVASCGYGPGPSFADDEPSDDGQCPPEAVSDDGWCFYLDAGIASSDTEPPRSDADSPDADSPDADSLSPDADSPDTDPGCEAESDEQFCARLGAECGTEQEPDNCGDYRTVYCGDCPDGVDCVDGQCVCEPDCAGAQCGDDGCGDSCGDCADGGECDDGVCVCAPACGLTENCCQGTCCGSTESCCEGTCCGSTESCCEGTCCGMLETCQNGECV